MSSRIVCGHCGLQSYADGYKTKLVCWRCYTKMRKAAEAYQSLATCYRLSRRPSESLLTRLENADKTMRTGQTAEAVRQNEISEDIVKPPRFIRGSKNDE